MTKQDFIRKFTSRKLWFAAALFISGLIVAFGGDPDTAQTIAGYVMQIGAALSYIIAEGWADAKRAPKM